MDAVPHNRFALGLTASLAVHALLMTANMGGSLSRPQATPALTVRINAAPKAATISISETAPPPHTTPRVPPLKSSEQPLPPRAARAASRAAPIAQEEIRPTMAQRARPVRVATQTPAAAPLPPTPIGPATDPLRTTPPAPAQPQHAEDRGSRLQQAHTGPRSTPDAAEIHRLAELNRLLHSAIDRYKRYPLSALRLGREGTARIKFRLFHDGRIEMLSLARSSGFDALDRAALAAVQGIEPFTPASRYIPDSERFEVDVVFRYN